MPASSVDANYRFIAASNELNARISQRQQALGLYITLVLGLLATLLGLRAADKPTLPVQWLSLGFPVASLCLVFLNYRTERVLTNLRSFLSALERLNDAHQQLPSYNTDPRWSQASNRARRFHDYTAALLVASGNGIALGALWQAFPTQMAHESPLFGLLAGVALGSVIALLAMPRLSYRPSID
jgi:hypothetical protein